MFVLSFLAEHRVPRCRSTVRGSEPAGVSGFWALRVPKKILPVSSSPVLVWGWAGGPGWEGLSQRKGWKRGSGSLTAVLKSLNQSPLS